MSGNGRRGGGGLGTARFGVAGKVSRGTAVFRLVRAWRGSHGEARQVPAISGAVRQAWLGKVRVARRGMIGHGLRAAVV